MRRLPTEKRMQRTEDFTRRGLSHLLLAVTNPTLNPTRNRDMIGVLLRSNFHWRRLWSSLASPNECLMLELSRAWDPLHSSRPLSNDKGKETQFRFPYGDKTTLRVFTKDQKKDGF